MPDANKKDGKLDGDEMLWHVGVVVKYIMVFDEFYEAVENE
jgi:hypothetical protein